MKRKLKKTRGETLVEVLASILIGALSVALLFTAVMASAKMDKTAKETDAKFSAVLNAAEVQETALTEGPDADGKTIVPSGAKVKISNSDASITDEATVSVTFYGGDGALSYKLP